MPCGNRRADTLGQGLSHQIHYSSTNTKTSPSSIASSAPLPARHSTHNIPLLNRKLQQPLPKVLLRQPSHNDWECRLRPCRQRSIIHTVPTPLGILSERYCHMQDSLFNVTPSVWHENQVAAASGFGSSKLLDRTLDKGFPIVNWGSIRGNLFCLARILVNKSGFVSLVGMRMSNLFVSFRLPHMRN